MSNQVLQTTKIQLSEKAYIALKEEIVTGVLKPGEVLSEVKIAKRLAISRTPLREALNKLYSERLVDIVPNKGCVVKKLELRDILEIAQVREALEGMVANLACEHIKGEELDEITSWFPPFDQKLKECDYIMAYEAGAKMHTFIRHKAHNRLIEEQLAFFDMQIQRTTRMAAEIPGRFEEAFKEHKAIIDALRLKDSDMAEKKMREHIANIRISLLFRML